MIKSVAVYCGHQFGTDPQFARDAEKFGELLAQHKIKMVFGAGDVGLMGAVANGALKHGGTVVGITTHAVVARQEPAHAEIAVEITNTINERKQRMFDLADAFCILPGGMGTLNELTDIMTMHQVGETKKPLFFLNTSKYWDIFGKVIVHMDQAGFIENTDDFKFKIASDPDELIGFLIADS